MGEEDWREQTHTDLGALHARVGATEKGISDLGVRLNTLGQETNARFDALGQQTNTRFDTVTTIINNVGRELTGKIDSVNSATLAARSTNWTGVLSAVGGLAVVILGIIGGLGAAVITPMNSKMSDTAASLEKATENMVRKDEYLAASNKIGEWLVKFNDRQREDEEKAARPSDIDDLKYRQRRIEDEYVPEKELGEFKQRVDERYKGALEGVNASILRLEGRVDGIDGQLVKRPEILALIQSVRDAVIAVRQAEDDRVNSLSVRLNEYDARQSAMFSPDKTIDRIWDLLTALFSQRPDLVKGRTP